MSITIPGSKPCHLFFLVAVALNAFTACRPPSASVNTVSSAPSDPKPTLVQDEWVGIWRGTSYADDKGIFHPSPPLKMGADGRPTRDRPKHEPTATIDMQLDVEEKHFSIKGAEVCWIALTYRSGDKEETEQRRFYRIEINDPADSDSPQTTFRLRGAVGEFQVHSLADDVMEIAGRIMNIGKQKVTRQVRVTLKRADERAAPADSPIEAP